MAEGNKSYKGLALPEHGEYEQFGISTTLDMATLTRITGGTGDFYVCQDDGGTEYFVISSAGDLTISGDVDIAAGKYLNLGSTVTTSPTTGLTKGDLFLVFSSSAPVLGACFSTLANGVKFLSPFDTKTLGRTT